MEHLLDHCGKIIAKLAFRYLIQIHKYRDKRCLSVCRHQCDHLILDHLHTTVDLFFHTDLRNFIDFILSRCHSDCFQFCADLLTVFFTADLYERCQMGK